MLWQLKRHQFHLPRDSSVASLLAQYRQDGLIRALFWEPLCLATLNTPIETASAQVFLHVLRDSFARQRQDAELLIPRVPLGELFCETAVRHLCRDPNNRFHLGSRVHTLHIEGEQLRALQVGNDSLPCRQAILATSPREAVRLLLPHPPLENLAQTIASLGSQPITTVYLSYPPTVQLPEPMLGLHGGIAQWLTDRRHAGQPGMIAVTISTGGPHMGYTAEQLCTQLSTEIQQHFPHWPTPLKARVIREKHATFACTVANHARRPNMQTSLTGLWLAGDYVANDYPATLEAAVRSGVQCAKAIIATRLKTA